MVGVGAGGPAPPLVGVGVGVGVGAPPRVVAAPRPPHLFSSSLRRRRPTAAKQKQGTRRRWWSESDSPEQEEEEDDDFFTGSGSFGGELFDEPWFSKVFKTYGFLLPVMLASMLVATGPKAFLMAMAIPLAQSAVSFLLDAIWGRRPFQRGEDGEEEEDFPEYSSDFASSYHRSWVSDDFAAASADYSTNKKSSGGSFGGWDELPDLQDDAGQFASKTDTRRTRRADAARASTRPPPLSRRRSTSAGNKYKQAPLLMRLMVAMFPFLGSWFRLL